jgi:[NiFe] hydrogenase diaphorase moiety small subunit
MTIRFSIDGREVLAELGQTILEAAEASGHYIPRLCQMKGLLPHGSCRLCLVKVNARPQAACVQPVAQGAVVESETPELVEARRTILEMLFLEGNHFCPTCEKSGSCELQALGYRLGVLGHRAHLFPERQIDATHPDALIDHNRCILCARCVRASRDMDGKHVFDFVGRGLHKRLAVNSESGLGGTRFEATDAALSACPVGALLPKRVGFAIPVGERKYDHHPIGSESADPISGD